MWLFSFGNIVSSIANFNTPMKKVLIAEDDKFLASAYQMKLCNSEYEVVIVADGQELLNYISAQKPDLIMLDLIMPVKDGFEVLEELRKNPKWRSVPVLVVTNRDEKADMARCKELGVREYILKSRMSLDMLCGKVKAVLKS